MEHTEILDYQADAKRGFLSKLFAAANPVNIFEKFQDIKDSFLSGIEEIGWQREEYAEYRQQNIDGYIAYAYKRAQSTSPEDLEKVVKEYLAISPPDIHIYGKIKLKHVMAQIEELSEEKKGELEQARLEWQSRKSAPILEA